MTEAVLIGIATEDPIDAVAAKVTAALGVTLAAHESSYVGDPYYTGWPASEVELIANVDPMYREGDPPEERWFSSSARDASYLLRNVAVNESVLEALREQGLDVAIVPE